MVFAGAAIWNYEEKSFPHRRPKHKTKKKKTHEKWHSSLVLQWHCHTHYCSGTSSHWQSQFSKVQHHHPRCCTSCVFSVESHIRCSHPYSFAVFCPACINSLSRPRPPSPPSDPGRACVTSVRSQVTGRICPLAARHSSLLL